MRAVIDVGSNSVLLIVCRQHGGVWIPVMERLNVTGLGRRIRSSGRLDLEDMDRTLAAIASQWREAEALGAQVRAFGTMALRLAENAEAFLAAAWAQHTPVEVLSGDDEARLGFLSVADDPAFREAERITIIDPGGHSTEIVSAHRTQAGWHEDLRTSRKIGALSLLEGSFSMECPGIAERMAAVAEVDDAIGFEFLPHSTGQAIALGAPATDLISIREGLGEWTPERVHGQVLDFEEVSRAAEMFCGMTVAERREVVGLDPGRENTIHAGCLILERCLHAIHALDCRVSVRGWRHAALENDAFFSV